ncbi:major facilitator superfamily domain-containing protein [Infundibulicybe gibba]|nr:major facilitator superfamily domain-containing protein [Infundibulicybe gibba]
MHPVRSSSLASEAKGQIEKVDPTPDTQREEKLEFSQSEERRLLWKFDLCLLPPLAFMYLCNALDKGNVGNAKTDGWDKDIHLKGNQYYLLVMIFYVRQLTGCSIAKRFGTPISLLVKRFSAARVLPIMMIGFVSSMNLVEFLTRSHTCTGVDVFYLSTFYKRNELASRVGIFYVAIRDLYLGLIAFGVFHINHPKVHSWQFLFWIEGAGTMLFAFFALLWLPRSPSTWKLLNEREKSIAKTRILTDSSVQVDERLDIRDAFRPFQDPMYWVWALINLSFGVPLASVNNFLPQIVASLGYSTIRTNLLTVAPNIVGTVALLLITFSSDHFRERSFHICHRHTAYFACFLLTMGAFAPSVLVSAWYSNNTPHESRRAVVAAVMVAIANSSGLISTNVFRAQDEPKYIPAAFGGLCLVLVASTGIYMRRKNNERNEAQGVNITAADVQTDALAKQFKHEVIDHG